MKHMKNEKNEHARSSDFVMVSVSAAQKMRGLPRTPVKPSRAHPSALPSHVHPLGRGSSAPSLSERFLEDHNVNGSVTDSNLSRF